MYSVYCHINKENGKRYFGATGMAPTRRWNRGRGYSKESRFGKAISKYGWDSFEHQVIERNLSEEDAYKLETELIEQYQTTSPEFGYNMSSGGKGGRSGIKEDPEATARRTRNMKGRVFTEEHRRKISEALTGIKRSEETKRKVSEANKGRKHTEEWRKRMSEVHKGFKMSEEAKQKLRNAHRKDMKRVYCVETDTIYESIASAAEALGVDKTNLCATCRGKHKHVGGYHVRYVDENSETGVMSRSWESQILAESVR